MAEAEPFKRKKKVEQSVSIEAVVENLTVDTFNEDDTLDEINPPSVPDVKKSPIEEKIEDLVAHVPASPVDGWSNNLDSAPVDGSRVMVSETGKDQGVLVYWRISRFADKAKLRYIPRGRWTEFLSRQDIMFVPKYWKPYNPEEYWPVRGPA